MRKWTLLAGALGCAVTAPAAWAQAAGDTADTNDITAIGRRLVDAGTTPRLGLYDEFAGNPSGGVRRGTRDSGSVMYGVDLDMDRLAGVPGGQFHAIINQTFGRSLNNDITKNAISFQAKYKPYRNDRLATITYEQSLFGGVVDITGGREPALSVFNTSPLFLQFQSNAEWPNPSVVPIQDKTLSFYPYDTWGGHIRINTSDSTYVLTGAYEANTALQPSDGYNWATATATGAEVPVELGYHSSFADKAMPTNARVGFWYNTSDYTDPYYNTKGASKVQAGGTALTRNGQSGFYLSGDQVIYRPDPRATRNLAIFGGMQAADDDAEVVRRQFHLGLVYTGPWESRPTDTIGIVGNLLQLGKEKKDFLQDSRRKAGGTDGVSSNEYIFEANYGVQLTSAINIRPNIQYVVNPDTILSPNTKFQPKNIFVVGCRLSMEIDKMLGINRKNSQ